MNAPKKRGVIVDFLDRKGDWDVNRSRPTIWNRRYRDIWAEGRMREIFEPHRKAALTAGVLVTVVGVAAFVWLILIPTWRALS